MPLAVLLFLAGFCAILVGLALLLASLFSKRLRQRYKRIRLQSSLAILVGCVAVIAGPSLDPSAIRRISVPIPRPQVTVVVTPPKAFPIPEPTVELVLSLPEVDSVEIDLVAEFGTPSQKAEIATLDSLASATETVEVMISSDPPGALVYIAENKEMFQVTPATFTLPKNQDVPYRVKAVEDHPDYDEYKMFEGVLHASESTTISVWLERTTKNEQELQKVLFVGNRILEVGPRIPSACNDLVKQSLIAPSTARFPGWLEQPEPESHAELGTVTYDSWVDAQNAFGAMLRTYFTCTYTVVEDMLRVTSIKDPLQ